MNWARYSSPDTGGDATSKRSREASFGGADEMVENGTFSKERIPKHSAIPTTPSARLRWFRIFFLMAQPPPPVSGGELPASHSFTASETAPINTTWTGSLKRRGMGPQPHLTHLCLLKLFF